MTTMALVKSDGPAGAAGTVLGSSSPVETGTWTEIVALGVIPSGGAMLQVVATTGAIRVATMPPSVVAVPPPHNGVLMPNNATFVTDIEEGPGARIWLKAA